MVFPTAEQPRDSYHLWRTFVFPTKHGSFPAVAIPKSWSSSVTGLYSSMVGIIFVGIWVFIIAIIRRPHHDNSIPIHRVAFHEEERFMKFRAWVFDEKINPTTPSGSWRWMAAVFAVWIINMGIGPALVSQLVLGEGAPANGNELFFPKEWDNITVQNNVQKQNNILKPSILRALSITELNIPDAVNRVQLSQQNLGNRSDGQQILQFDYSYNLTARDFGMQHLSHLGFTVQGSCYTEYGWLQGGGKHNAYLLWNTGDPFWWNVTLSQQQFDFPRAIFTSGNDSSIGVQQTIATNKTYAVLVSTAGKTSYTPGTDPWYLTEAADPTSSSSFSQPVLDDRPPLSCWEINAWTWRGTQIGDIWNVIYNKPDHGLPTIMRDVFYTALWQPGIMSTAQNLDTINLAVANQDLSQSFDAGSGSILKDLRRMLVTTFVWNANILFDTTLYSANTLYEIRNLIEPQDRTAVADFVVFTPNATAMSLVFIIVVPCLVVLMFLLNWLIGRELDNN
jgi:hypothetical protein